MNKIAFYQERTFSEKFNVTFEFLKENWKVVLRYITYVCLPMSLVGGWFFNSLMSVMQKLDTASDSALVLFGLTYGGIVLLMSLAGWWLATVMCSLIQAYNSRPDGLVGITFGELKPSLKHNAFRLFKLGLVGLLLSMVWVGLLIGVSLIHPMLGFLFFIASMVLFVPLLHVMPVYMYEDISVWRAFSRGIWLGWNTWGGTFALGFVLALLASVVQGVLGMPWQICYVVKMLFTTQAEETSTFFSSAGFMLISYLASIVLLYTQFVCSSLFFVGISYLYSHAAESLDDMSVEQGIDQFEEMADHHEDAEISDFDKL